MNPSSVLALPLYGFGPITTGLISIMSYHIKTIEICITVCMYSQLSRTKYSMPPVINILRAVKLFRDTHTRVRIEYRIMLRS